MREKGRKISKYSLVIKYKDGKCKTYSTYTISLDYKVKPKDTVWGITHKYGLDMGNFCENNNIQKDTYIIKVGENKKIQKLAYKIEKGETLSSIARKFGLTTDILMQLNGIDDGEVSNLEVGRMIELPGLIYKVKAGETPESIASKFGIDVNVLKNINCRKPFKPGNEIRVLYNNPDYDKAPEAVNTQIINGKKVEKIDMSKTDKVVQSRKYLRYKTKVNGLVVANRAEFAPKGNGKGPLSGKTIIINAGHGYGQASRDPGAVVEKDGLNHEWILNYDNAMRIIPELQKKGARVIYLQGHRNLIQKALKQPENKGDLFISIHANIGKGDNSTKDRTQFYYRDNVQKGDARDHSIKFAEIAERKFDESYKSEAYAEVRTNDDRTGLLKTPVNNQKIAGIIWEVAFMDSAVGRKRLKDNTTMKNYMNKMVESVVEYFKYLEFEKQQKKQTK